jgi:hypothetical protein
MIKFVNDKLDINTFIAKIKKENVGSRLLFQEKLKFKELGGQRVLRLLKRYS